MTSRFCPDCSQEVQEKDPQCPDCGFPLEIIVETGLHSRVVRGKEVGRWNRIAQLLTRNGVKVEHKPYLSWEDQKFWWIFPGAGVIFLLCTFAFGPFLANWIWPPRPLAGPITVESNPIRSAVDPDQNPQPVPELPEESSEPALIADGEYREARAGIDYYESYEPISNESQLVEDDLPQQSANQALQGFLVTIDAGGPPIYGSILGQKNIIIAPKLDLESRYERKTRTIKKDGVFTQEVGTDPPPLRYQGQTIRDSFLFVKADKLPFIFIGTAKEWHPEGGFSYFANPGKNQTVWILFPSTVETEAQKAKVGEKNVDGLTSMSYFNLDTRYGSSLNGSPIVNNDGELLGVFMTYQGFDAFVPLVDIVNRVPEAYTEAK